ncbi:CD63 antigen-like [Rhodnius prolixus]|uniref:Tetraspanin n=2 Tax=Rhodnius TaxID=13248 RepID=R4G4G4_RHOPR
MDSIGMSCIKYLLFLFNLLFAVSGIIIFSVGIMIQQMYSSYSIFIGEKLFTLPFIFIIVGIFIFVVAFFGCCGAIKESNYMLITFAAFLCLIFVLEAAGGIVGFIMKDDINEMLESRMDKSLKEYNGKNIYYAKTWNAVQHDFSCCGVKSYTDWSNIITNGTLPHSCCPQTPLDERCLPEYANKEGCLPAFENALEHNIFLIIAFGISVAVVQFVGVIFACCMSRSIRKCETV